MSCIDHELGCKVQKVEMEKCQRSAEDIEKHGVLTEQEMERRAQVRGRHALLITANEQRSMEFVNRDFDAATDIWRYAVPERRLPALMGANFLEIPHSECM